MLLHVTCSFPMLDRLSRFGLALLLISSGPIEVAAREQSLVPQVAAGMRLQAQDPGVQGDVYIIGPGDVLELKLFDAPDLSGRLEVLNDGSVSLPLVGSVRVSGLTIQQASFWAQKLLGEQLLRPELQLQVAQES